MINFQSGCDYHIVFIDGTAFSFKFHDTQGGGIRIEVPPGGQECDLDKLISQHGGFRSIMFLGCPNTP